MSYRTFDRFQGIWLGSIIGQALANRIGERTKIIDYRAQWLITRDKIAEILLETERLEVSYITHQLAEILQSKENIDLQNSDRANSQEFLLTQDSDRVFLGNEIEKNRSLKYDSNLLSMLPLIIFYGNERNLFTEVISQCDLKLANTKDNAEYIEDILLWSYLLTLALNNKLLPDTNVSLIVRQILTGALVKKTSLIAKLETVVEAWEQGISLHQLSELLSKNNSKIGQTAIALSIYCFATTPQDFRLSIERAASLEPQTAWLTTALTGTISGAYNGIAGIPKNWRAMANQNFTYQSASQTVVKLFKAWLGVYLIDSDRFSYNQELDAVATPNVIQSRPALKIISQKSF